MRVAFTFTVFTLSLLLSSCGQGGGHDKPLSDAEISDRIVGIWKVNETALTGVSSSGTVSIFKNGSVACDVKYVRGERNLVMNYTASWQVEKGILVQIIKTTGNSNLLAEVDPKIKTSS